MQKNQLLLIDTTTDDNADFRLDERTRELGRDGVAKAREALRKADVRRAA